MSGCSRLGVLIRHPVRTDVRPDWALTEQYGPLSLPQEATKPPSNEPTKRQKDKKTKRQTDESGVGRPDMADGRGFDPVLPAGDVAQRAFMGRFRHAMKPHECDRPRVPAYSLRSRGQRSETIGVGRPDMADGRGFDPAPP